MSDTTHTPDWETIGKRLREPFDPRDVDFRVQGKANEQTGRAQVVAYIDARTVQDRLDDVVGAGNWAFDWEPLVVEKGDVQVAKGTLTIYGVSKSDAGTASNFEQSLGAVSHCFKRAAVHWGVGRYLYSLPSAWVAVEKNGRISDATLKELRAKLPRPGQAATPPAEDNTQPQPPQANGNAAKRQPAQPRQPQAKPRQPVDPSLDERLDVLLDDPDMKRMYIDAGTYGYKGNAFFTTFIQATGISKGDLLNKRITVAHKDAMRDFIAQEAAKAQAAQARTPDLATVATSGVRA